MNITNFLLGYIRRSVTNRLRKLLSLSAAVQRLHLNCVQFWVPQFKKGVENLNRAHQRASKIFRGPYHITYKEKLKKIHSSSLTKRKLRGDLFVDRPANM